MFVPMTRPFTLVVVLKAMANTELGCSGRVKCLTTAIET